MQGQSEEKMQRLDEVSRGSSPSVRNDSLLRVIAFGAVVLAACSLSAVAKEKPREVVTLIENESTTTPYNWEVDGHISVSCYGSSCSGYYRPPTSGTQQIQGAILKLQRSDSSVVIAQCVAKVDVLSSLIVSVAAAADNDPNSPTVFRNCRIPAANSTVEAEFDLHHNLVKLFMLKPGAEASGKITSETYYVRGVLQPASSVDPAASASVLSTPKSAPANSVVRVEQLNAQLMPLAAQYREIKSQSQSFVERCKGRVGEGDCLDSGKKLLTAEVEVTNSVIPLLEEKVALLNSAPQNAWIRAEKEESIPILDHMRTENQSDSATLAKLADFEAHASAPMSIPASAPEPVSLVATKAPALPAPAPLAAVENPAKPGVPSRGLDLKQIDQELLELESSARDFSDQWAIFQKECPGPTTDEICLDDKRQVSVAMVANTKSRIRLIDQKIALLDAGPQDTAAQQAEDESVKKRGDLTAAQRSSQELIASLEKSLAGLKREREGH